MKVFIKARNEVHVPAVLALHNVSEAVVADEDRQVVIADLPEESINALREHHSLRLTMILNLSRHPNLDQV